MNTNDLAAPFDPTAYDEITGAQLLQYLQGATPSSDRGFCLYTTDIAGVPVVPDAANTAEWKRYIWLRQTATSLAAYAWNDTASSHATYLKWVSLNISGIGVGSITGDMIADNTITDIKIISLDWSKLTGVPPSFTPGGDAGGDLTGTYPDPTIAAGAVTTSKIDDDAVTEAKIADESVTYEKIAPNGVGLTQLRTNAGATAVEWFVPTNWNNYAIDLDASAANYTGAGNVIAVDNSIPQIGEGSEILSVVITPQFATSKLRIQVVVNGDLDGAYFGIVSAFSTAPASNDAVVAMAQANTTIDGMQQWVLDTIISPNTTAPVTVTVRVGISNAAATFYLNGVTTGRQLGTAQTSSLVVTEIVIP